MTALIAKALAVIASSSWVPIPAPDPAPVKDPMPKHHHKRPKRPDPPPLSTALASYYSENGVGACGYGSVQSGYRFASLILRCGTRIRICHTGCVTATMSDHGPYVAGRTFDLNVALKNAIGCGDLCTVRWRIA